MQCVVIDSPDLTNKQSRVSFSNVTLSDFEHKSPKKGTFWRGEDIFSPSQNLLLSISLSLFRYAFNYLIKLKIAGGKNQFRINNLSTFIIKSVIYRLKKFHHLK